MVTVHPTNLDTHGAGLTFHGVHAKLATYVPHTDIEPFVLFHDTRGVVGNQPGVVGNQTEVVGQLTLIVAMDLREAVPHAGHVEKLRRARSCISITPSFG